MEYTREMLIEICEKSFVPQSKWNNRDSFSAQKGVAMCYMLLKAGCKFQIKYKEDFKDDTTVTNEDTIWLKFWAKDFTWFDVLDMDEDEYPDGRELNDVYYLPTLKKIEAANGQDWYDY